LGRLKRRKFIALIGGAATCGEWSVWQWLTLMAADATGDGCEFFSTACDFDILPG
jgi:hypothetical protein